MKLLKSFVILSISIAIISLNLGCKKTTETTAAPANKKATLSQNKITKKEIEDLKYTDYVLSDNAQVVIGDWERFGELETTIEGMKSGNLSFFKTEKSNNELNIFFSDFKNTIPLSLSTQLILVRISVLETYFLKLEDILNYTFVKKDVLKTIKDILTARSNLILLINKKIGKDSQNVVKPTF